MMKKKKKKGIKLIIQWILPRETRFLRKIDKIFPQLHDKNKNWTSNFNEKKINMHEINFREKNQVITLQKFKFEAFQVLTRRFSQ